MQEIIPDGRKHTEADYFAQFYAQPVRSVVIIKPLLAHPQKGVSIHAPRVGSDAAVVKVEAVTKRRGARRRSFMGQMKRGHRIRLSECSPRIPLALGDALESNRCDFETVSLPHEKGGELNPDIGLCDERGDHPDHGESAKRGGKPAVDAAF